MHERYHLDSAGATNGIAALDFGHCVLGFAIARETQTVARRRDRALFDFLEASLRHRSDMVIYEAATAICSLTSVAQRELSPSITVLQLFLCSPKPACRFSAVRTLNKIAMAHPMAVTPCNMDMEGLIKDSNRSIATLAITTLLKTGSESGVERLMKQITSTGCS
uniref:Clathrin/coatomer adaptor adaptin-like N-terminal domain-containing protein n=1 Tax=Emiliania huxleyi (strain CCMP1516) TaxID=280463 RepID=A0A0D3IZ99_EMIH1